MTGCASQQEKWSRARSQHPAKKMEKTTKARRQPRATASTEVKIFQIFFPLVAVAFFLGTGMIGFVSGTLGREVSESISS